VEALFKNPDPGKTHPIIKGLDEDVLPQSPRASRAHWLATCMVQRLRRPVGDICDLSTVLAPRSTSWARDRTIITSLLVGIPGVDVSVGESVMARQILEYLGKFPTSVSSMGSLVYVKREAIVGVQQRLMTCLLKWWKMFKTRMMTQ
jgi:hypothetical protein